LAFDLNPFLENISQYGYTSPAKFDVVITNPSFLSSYQNFASIPQILQLRAEKVNVPSVMLLANESNIYGPGPLVKQPYAAAMGDLGITFIADKKSIIYSYFYTWMNYIYNFSDTYSDGGASLFTSSPNSQNFQSANYLTNFEDDYVASSITVNYYDQVGNNFQKINVYRAKPMQLVSTPLDWSATDQALRISVVFNYREWSLAIPDV
jgi:hypothetical protein